MHNRDTRRGAQFRRMKGKPLRRLVRPTLEVLEHRRLLTGDVIMEWNAVALEVNRVSYSGDVVNDQIGPTRSSRALAIVHAAMFDAWNSVHGEYTPYLTVAPNAAAASDEAAVAKAAHDALFALYPSQQPYIASALAETLERVVDGPQEDAGIEVGKFIAQTILASRAEDGSEIPGDYVPDGQIGRHDVDPLNPNQGFLTPAWGDVTPFVLADASDIEIPPPPALGSPEYTHAYEQVKRFGEESSTERTTDQTELAIYWGYDVARGLGDPPRLYNQIARVIAEQQENSVGENARMFALMNLAMADAGIVSWDVKYRDGLWRPIVGIREGDHDGNPDTAGDPDWGPLGAPRTNPAPGEDVNFTPPFPAYTSGHATFGGAAFKTLANFYQTDDVHFSIPFDFVSDEFNGVSRDIHEAIPELILDHVRQMRPRHFESFSQAAAENAASRIFLGVHWRFDGTEGLRSGNKIADYAFDHLLRPTHGRPPTHIASADFESQLDAYLEGDYKDYFRPHDPVLHWNQVALETMRKDSLLASPDVKGPTEGSLALGYIHTAIYDAVNAIDGSHTRYVYDGHGGKHAQMEAAVGVAAHTTLVKLYPSHRTYLDVELQTYLDAFPDSPAEVAGVGVGWMAANQLLELRENDGRHADMSHTLVDEPGRHQPDPLHPDQGFLSPKWGRIQPFAMTDGDQFRAPAPPALDSQEYAAAYNEVMIVGAADAETADRDGNGLPDRTPEQTEIGLFWAYDGSRNLSTPPRMYNQIVREIARQQRNSVIENARLFALVNVAMADAGIASWESKYVHDLWRPIVAIRGGDADGNPATQGDPDWRPLGAPASNSGDPDGNFTPPFPAYTSGHATFGGAVFRMLELFYGTDEIAFSFQSDELNGVTQGADGVVRPAVTRHFDSLSQAMQENAQSRIYLGIHWQFDATAGMDQGSAIADYVFAHKFLERFVFQNDELSVDVDADGKLSLRDIFVQVHQLRHYSLTGEMEPGFEGFCDVNGDEQFTVADLLDVVHAMRGAAESAQGASELSGHDPSSLENDPGNSSLIPNFNPELPAPGETVEEDFESSAPGTFPADEAPIADDSAAGAQAEAAGSSIKSDDEDNEPLDADAAEGEFLTLHNLS